MDDHDDSNSLDHYPDIADNDRRGTKRGSDSISLTVPRNSINNFHLGAAISSYIAAIILLTVGGVGINKTSISEKVYKVYEGLLATGGLFGAIGIVFTIFILYNHCQHNYTQPLTYGTFDLEHNEATQLNLSHQNQ